MKYLYCDLADAMIATETNFPEERCEICQNDCEISPEKILILLEENKHKSRE